MLKPVLCPPPQPRDPAPAWPLNAPPSEVPSLSDRVKLWTEKGSGSLKKPNAPTGLVKVPLTEVAPLEKRTCPVYPPDQVPQPSPMVRILTGPPNVISAPPSSAPLPIRSEDRRVGNEGVRPGRTRWS